MGSPGQPELPTTSNQQPTYHIYRSFFLKKKKKKWSHITLMKQKLDKDLEMPPQSIRNKNK